MTTFTTSTTRRNLGGLALGLLCAGSLFAAAAGTPANAAHTSLHPSANSALRRSHVVPDPISWPDAARATHVLPDPTCATCRISRIVPVASAGRGPARTALIVPDPTCPTCRISRIVLVVGASRHTARVVPDSLYSLPRVDMAHLAGPGQVTPAINPQPLPPHNRT